MKKYFLILLFAAAQITIALFNLLGEKILEQEQNPAESIHINTSCFAKGLYILVLRAQNRTYSLNLLK